MSIPLTTRHLPVAFQRLAWSNLAAQSAEQIALAAAPLIAVLAFGAGAGETGWLQTAQTLPFLLLAMPAGLLADRGSRQRLMVLAEALRMVSLLGVLLLASVGLLTLPLLAALGLLGACGTVAYSVAAPALVPALVPADALARANGRIELARTVEFAAGPALGGLLVGWTGGQVAFAAAAGLSLLAVLLLAVLLLAGIVEPPGAAAPRRSAWAELREGASFVSGHHLLRPVFTTAVIFNLAMFVLQAAYVPHAIDGLRMTPWQVGATLSAYGLGMVAGALAAPRLMRSLRFGTVVAIGPVSAALSSLLMMGTLLWRSPIPAALSFFLFGAGPIVWVISTTTLRQRVTPDSLMARAGALMTTAQGARPIGAALAAVVGGQWGAPACLALASAAFFAQAAVVLTSPLVRLAVCPGTPADPGERNGVRLRSA